MAEPQFIDLTQLRRGYEAIGHQDWNTATEHYHPGIEWVDPPAIPGGGTHSGIVEIRDAWKAWGESWQSWEVIPLEMTVRGDQVLVHTQIKGVGAGSGAEVELTYWQLWTYRDGQVIRQQGFQRREQAEAAIAAEGGDS